MSVTSRRAELLSAAFWAMLGSAILIASWRMERLTQQGINVWSAPGLLPGVVGLLMVLFAIALALQARRGGAADADAEAAAAEGTAASSTGLRQSALAALLCLAFAGVSLGHGLPFQVEAAIFIVLFTAVFRWAEWRAGGRRARGLAQAAAVAVVAATAIGWFFESVFLVRLP